MLLLAWLGDYRVINVNKSILLEGLEAAIATSGFPIKVGMSTTFDAASGFLVYTTDEFGKVGLSEGAVPSVWCAFSSNEYLNSDVLDLICRRREFLVVPASGMSPVLWQSRLLLVVARSHEHEADRLVRRLRRMLHDNLVDPLFLLSQVELLNRQLDQLKTAGSIRSDTEDSLHGEIAALRRELRDLRHTAALQQSALAAAFQSKFVQG
jgi:hypothetical protein